MAALGRLKVLVDRYPLSAAKQAYDDFEHGRLVGRAVLMPAPEKHQPPTQPSVRHPRGGDGRRMRTETPQWNSTPAGEGGSHAAQVETPRWLLKR